MSPLEQLTGMAPAQQELVLLTIVLLLWLCIWFDVDFHKWW